MGKTECLGIGNAHRSAHLHYIPWHLPAIQKPLSACLHLILFCDVWHKSVGASVSPLCHPRLSSRFSGTRCAQVYRFPRPWVADMKPDTVNVQMLPRCEHHSRCVTVTVHQTLRQGPLQRLVHSNQGLARVLSHQPRELGCASASQGCLRHPQWAQ